MKYKVALAVLGVAVIASIILILIIREKRQECSGSTCAASFKINTNYATPEPEGSASANATPAAAASPDLTYKNSAYNFEIALSEAWKGYKIETPAPPSGAESEIDFVLPSTSSATALKIFVYKIASFDGAQETSRGTEITRNASYVFSYKTWDSPPPDLVQITDKEIADRLATFKLLY